MVLIDGVVVIGRSRNTPPAARAAESSAAARPGGAGRRTDAVRAAAAELRARRATARLAEMGAYLRHAEDLGFDSAMLIDHLLIAPPAYRVDWLEPVSLLRALAGVTRTIRLGTLVLVLPFRDPVAFAKEWATLDVLSGGRSILGVGVGWNKEEFAALRIPIKDAAGG